jgi:hypothetical protein
MVDDVMDLDDMVIEVPNTLGSNNCHEQSQVNRHDSGFGIPKESQLVTKVCTIEGVQDDPTIGNDPNMITTTPPILRSGIQKDPNPIGTKLYMPKSGVQKAPQASKDTQKIPYPTQVLECHL